MTLEQDLRKKVFVERARAFRADLGDSACDTTIAVEETGGAWPDRGSCVCLTERGAFAQFVCKAPEDLKGNAAFIRGLWAIGVRTNMDETEHLFFCAIDGWRLAKELADYRGKTEGIERLFEFIRSLLVQAGLPLRASKAAAVTKA